jgi:hypothetical protein
MSYASGLVSARGTAALLGAQPKKRPTINPHPLRTISINLPNILEVSVLDMDMATREERRR